MVDSIYSSAVHGQLQFFRSMQLHLTLLAAMLCMMDPLNGHLKNLHKQAVAKTVQKFLLLFYLSSFCLRLQASLIFAVFPRSASVGAC